MRLQPVTPVIPVQRSYQSTELWSHNWKSRSFLVDPSVLMRSQPKISLILLQHIYQGTELWSHNWDWRSFLVGPSGFNEIPTCDLSGTDAALLPRYWAMKPQLGLQVIFSYFHQAAMRFQPVTSLILLQSCYQYWDVKPLLIGVG